MKTKDETLYTLKEVAKYFRVSTLTVKRWGKRKELTPIRINGRGDRRYRWEDIQRYLKSIKDK